MLGTFGRAWAVELRKVAATPSLVVGLAIGIAATPLAALVVADRSDAAESMTAVRLAVSAAMIPVVAFALWGAYATTSEYERGAIVGSLLAVPRRSSFYTAKLAAVATVVGVAMTLSAAVAVVVVGLAAPPPGLAVGPWWAVPVIGLIVGAVAAVGAAAGFILRGSITTSGTLLVALLGPSVLGSALGGAQRWFTGAAPTALIAHAAGSDRPELGAAAGSIVFTVVVVVVGVVGWRVFARADH
ncbi:MAG TPA: hypothetical protein PK331_17075 [Gordonia sp. (in: high G+C Gram-positive bacteria)]|uniref:hypothetical protein n=1 Tax=unclassified Gordonia (in: high G+C Gram-positive bacteria) TaxID=2657482 RepID=UPI000F930D00|nr:MULTISPECIES: hypothetical protein [unclassified Gordonia (in: high G+C Gram-positive bacteria)]RUP37008.1 MAG: hypothetical protein EKK60_13565 [Gordonia sp. (in: high G+C Gram-positive bacteria)]HNP58926.1 hypothetical protein [Gordonia sp. (in: high G+C Gram-positive bacteria)]HRC52617.1 hypothetical protein [Gordonia sp. (in: high G+C Gram-positive bacteria)]